MRVNSISAGKFNSTFKYMLRPLLIMLALMMPSVVNAAADIMVTPSRIIFDERTRTAQVTLMNPGTETGEFRISFLRLNMNDKGEFSPVEADEKGMFSDPLIRYSPRQLTLPPGQSQVIRLMLRKPKDLENGEYRSHMLFQMLPQASKSSIRNTADADQKTIAIEIIPTVGISIPVIVRHGKLKGELKLDNARIIPATEVEPKPSISVDMHRSGNQSVYGDFRAILTPNGGEPIVIALANGIAVYSPNTLRQFSIPLNTPSEISLKEGHVRILFLESGKNEETGLIAETRLQL